MSTVLTIAAREYTERIKQKGFIIGTVLGVLLVVALSFISVIGSLLSGSFSTRIVVIAPGAAVAKLVSDSLTRHAVNSLYIVSIAAQHAGSPQLPAAIESELKAKKYDAGLVAYYNRAGRLSFAYYPRQSAALDEGTTIKQRLLPAVIISDAQQRHEAHPDRELSFAFATTNLNERYKSAAEESNSQVLVYVLLILMYIAVLMYGIYVAQGVIEEKSNRVMELMIGAVRPAQLLAGKILGIGSLALTQLLVIGLASLAIQAAAAAQWGERLAQGLQRQAPSAPHAMNVLTVPASIWIFLIVFFLLGFFTYATMFAGVGALASRPEDLQQTSGSFTLPIVIAYFLSLYALVDPDKPIVVWGSLLPMLSPMVMFARLSTSVVPPWQIAVSILASLATIWLFTLLAGKLYRVGVLMYGKPLAPKEIIRALGAHT